MRQSTVTTRPRVEKRKAGQHVAPTVRRVADNFLTLPVVSKQIPTLSVSMENDGEWLKVAQLCAELVSDDELDINEKSTAREIVSTALSAWASRLCADVQVLDKFSLIASLELDVFGIDYEGDKKNDQQLSWYVGFQSEQMTNHINVKKKIEALENLHPGLGRTAIQYAEIAGYKTFTVFSPSMGFYHGQHLYWMGADSDEEFIEEMECTGEKLDPDDVLLPSHYLAAFPEVFFSGKSLEREVLQGIALENSEASETSKVILSIMDLVDQSAELPGFDGFYAEQAYFSVYMALDEESNTMFNRVLDDFYQDTSNDDHTYTDMYGVATLSFNKKSFLKWRDQTEKGFLLYQKLDHLMRLIGEVKP